jgi:hypothetical protein
VSDIALFKSSPGTAVLEPRMFTDVDVVDGIELLAQRFVGLLLREYDAVFNRGTTLMAQVRGGGVSGATMNIIVNLAVAQAAQQMPAGATPSETLSKVRVVSVSKTGDRLAIALEITAQSAESTTTTTTVRTA